MISYFATYVINKIRKQRVINILEKIVTVNPRKYIGFYVYDLVYSYLSENYSDLDTHEECYRMPKESEFRIKANANIPGWFEKFEKKYNPEGRRLYSLKNAKLVGGGPIVLTERGYPVDPIEGSSDLKKKKNRYIQKRFTGTFGRDIKIEKLIYQSLVQENTKKEETTVFSLLYGFGGGYYHWMLEELPKIRTLKFYKDETGNNPLVLVPNELPEYALDSLKRLGICRERCVKWNHEKLKLDNLLIPKHRFATGGIFREYEPSYEDYIWVKNKLVQTVSGENKHYSKIFVSRQKQDRSIKNISEIEPVLSDNGFKTVFPEDMDLEEQVRLFSSVEYVVAPHGAGLTNLLFATEGTRVLELLPQPENNPHYFRLSSILSLEYDCIISTDYKGDRGDFRIDPEKLDQHLSE